MEERGTSPPPWLPVPRTEGGPPALPDPPNAPPPGPPPPRPRFGWRRFARSPRGAAGLAVLAAALLLWPFAGLSWIPWLIGVGALIVLRILRLDGPLRGWDLPLAGLAVVIGLMVSTGPWAWALAASIGVLLAGLAQLPWWRLAAVGAVLCVISGVGYGISVYQDNLDLAKARARVDDATRAAVAVESARIVPALIKSISQSAPDPDLFCLLLSDDAEGQIAQASGSEDCSGAAVVLHSRYAVIPHPAPGENRPDGASPDQPPPPTLVLDACRTEWAETAGLALGRVHIGLLDPIQRTYTVTGFSACPAS